MATTSATRLLRVHRSIISPSVTCCSTFTNRSGLSLEVIAATHPNLQTSLEHFHRNDIKHAIDIALDEYQKEHEERGSLATLMSSKNEDEKLRPAYSFLSQMMASLGPHHPETAGALARLESLSGPATPFKVRVIQKQHGGYPVRLNNGKWTWQGPHWSRPNNRTWKTGFSSDFTYGWGK